MKFRVLFALTAAAAMAGCFTESAPSDSQKWLLLESPPMPGYSEGSVATPFSRWKQVNEYASRDTCTANLQQTQNLLQNPVACMATNDPRLRQSAATETR